MDGYCQIDEHMFDKDALIIENRQASKVSLCTPDKKPYLTVSFDAPLFGLWSPAGMGAPLSVLSRGTADVTSRLCRRIKGQGVW